MLTPENATELIESIKEKFSSNIDTGYIESMKKLVDDEDRVMGVRVPIIKSITNDFMKEHGKELDTNDLLTLADECFKTEGREEQLFAVFALSKRVKKMDRDAWRLIDNWVDYISNWETCDQLATQFAGKILLANIDLITDLKKWAKQTNVWRRRFAAASTVALNHAGHSNPTATFEVLRPLVADNNPMVRKAVAWAIREAARADENSAYLFLREVKDVAVPYVLKYGSEKLTDAHMKELAL